MHYDAYRRRTQEAAASLGGKFISLAGGLCGFYLTTDDDNCFLILALDLDGSGGWTVWTEDTWAKRKCQHVIQIGWPSIAHLAHVARNAVAEHVCPT